MHKGGEDRVRRKLWGSFGRLLLLLVAFSLVMAGCDGLFFAPHACENPAACPYCLPGVRGFIAGMGIVLNAGRIYPAEWLILLMVFAISILPTSVMTLHMSRRDSIDR